MQRSQRYSVIAPSFTLRGPRLQAQSCLDHQAPSSPPAQAPRQEHRAPPPARLRRIPEREMRNNWFSHQTKPTCSKATGLEMASEISLATSCCSAMSSIISWTWRTLCCKAPTIGNDKSTLSTSRSALAFFKALAASFIVLSTAVLVLAPSRASLCISIVDKVPSICWSCLSYLKRTGLFYIQCSALYLFFLFRACRADLLFVLAFFRAVATSWSIFFSRNSC